MCASLTDLGQTFGDRARQPPRLAIEVRLGVLLELELGHGRPAALMGRSGSFGSRWRRRAGGAREDSGVVVVGAEAPQRHHRTRTVGGVRKDDIEGGVERLLGARRAERAVAQDVDLFGRRCFSVAQAGLLTRLEHRVGVVAALRSEGERNEQHDVERGDEAERLLECAGGFTRVSHWSLLHGWERSSDL